MENKNNYRFGWQREIPDFRDISFEALSKTLTQIPASVDLQGKCPAIYDQGHLGSCTANALGAAYEFEQMKQAASAFMPSRLFIYYNERKAEGTVDSDNGAAIRDGIKVIHKQGVCPETLWPYHITDYKKEPSINCYNTAVKHTLLKYLRVTHTLEQMKACLAEGFPFVFGFTVYESFMTTEVAKTGLMPMPKKTETVKGGHAVMAVGFDDSKKAFVVRNSWGTNWGMKGYFLMPYDYITHPDLSSDFWTLRLV